MGKVKLLLLLGILMSLGTDSLAQAPHAYYSDVALSAEGLPVPGASVLVYQAGTKNKAQLYKGASAGTTKIAWILDLTSSAKDTSTTGWGKSDFQAFDDNTVTLWSSAASCLPPYSKPSSSHEWIWVDIGADVPLLSVSVDYEDSAAVDYTIRLLTQAQGASLGLAENGQAGGGPEKWTIIATAADLPNGVKGPYRKLPGIADVWDFINGMVVVPGNTTGTATVNVTKPVGRYLMIDVTEVSSAYWGNVAIREITIETEWNEDVTMKLSIDTTASDGFTEQDNPIIAGDDGRFGFFVVNGNYDIHISAADTNYSLTDVTLVNPHSPHNIRSSSQTPPLTLVERGETTSGGNAALVFDRPGSLDGNNPPVPYRMFVNKGQHGWALTLNADWDEITGTWKKRTLKRQSYIFRINGNDHSLEFANDYFTALTAPVMETLFRISADGEISTKAYSNGWNGLAMEVRNDTGSALSVGNVVVLNPHDPFSVIAPRKYADDNPMVIYAVDGSRVFVIIEGRAYPKTPYLGGDIGTKVKAGDLLVTEGPGSFRAIVGNQRVDLRTVIGKVSNTSLSVIIPY